VSADARPVLHITQPRGWINDPNGLVHWQGTHHVFHQSDPDSLWFGTMNWGHVSSTDLLHWQRDEPALMPSQPPDADGCWTGCVVEVDGVATAVYTGVVALGDDRWTQTVCLATATDPGLRGWRKHPGNPVEVEPPGFPVTAFRDPYVWRDDSGWVMLLGSALPSGEGAVLCYRSPDLLRWSYHGVAVSGGELLEGLWTGAVWECPALMRVSEDRTAARDRVHQRPGSSTMPTAEGNCEDGRLAGRPGSGTRSFVRMRSCRAISCSQLSRMALPSRPVSLPCARRGRCRGGLRIGRLPVLPVAGRCRW
jgi:beta-fructofuranosidase